MKQDEYEYLSKSTVGLLSFKKSPNKYANSDIKPEEYAFLQRSAHTPTRKQWNVSDYEGIKRTPEDFKNLRQTFDTRTNNKFQQAYTRSSVYDNQPHSANVFSKSQYNLKPASPSSFQLGSISTYDRGYKKEQFNPSYLNKFDKTVKSPISDKKVDIDEKYKFYAEAVQKFKEQVQVTSKMSDELKKLKEDRKKRLQAKEKQKEKQLQIYKQIQQLKEKQKQAQIYKQIKLLKQKQKEKQKQKQKQIFKKKSAYEYYSPKQQKTYNLEKYTTDSNLKTLNLDKYKSYTTTKTETDSNKNNEIKRKVSGKYDQYVTQAKTTPISTATSSLTSSIKAKNETASIFNGQIKDFLLGKLLGQGKFGTVYQAFHKNNRSLYALKKIPKQMIKSHLMIDQFCLEVKLQMFLNHPNILTLFNFFDDKTHIYLVLEYMEEGTLFTHLKKNKKLPQAQVAIKVRQIASAVQYLHQNQIAHRDIKPQNIVMSHGVCKLCDFGWATVCDERRKTYCGTFDYAPPQILAGAQYDYTVDLWCLGVLTYQLLVGKAPFYHISRKQTMKKILNVQKTVLQYPQGISKNAISFIDNLIKKDPKDRISSDQILAHPFLKNAVSKIELKKSF